MKKLVSILLVLLASLILWRCASQTTPNGGPKDETPPKLRKSVPANNQTNFSGKVIELTFDELLKLNNPKEEIIITPSPGKDVTITLKQNKVLIEPKQKWKDSTTYSISFREGIQDLNEGNPAEDLHLAFSTGPTIDSLHIAGTIAESLTEKIPEKITVALYQEDTFDIFKHTPVLFTKTQEDGSFKIDNLKAGVYNVYAFDDKNKNLRIESINEKFGFISSPIHVQKNVDTLHADIYKIDSRPLKINSIRRDGNVTHIKLNKSITSFYIQKTSNENIFASFAGNQSEIDIYNELNLTDSIKIKLTGADSIQQKIDSSFYIKRTETNRTKEKFALKLIRSSLEPETYKLQAKVSYSKPIRLLNFDSIYITPDKVPEKKIKHPTSTKGKEQKGPTSTIAKPEEKKDTVILKIHFPKKDIILDTAKKTLSIITMLDKKLIPPKTKSLNLVLEESFLISVESDTSKRIISELPIKTEESTGTLHIEIKTKFKNYEVQLIGSTGEVVAKARNVKKYTFRYLPPQSYKLMIYADLNNNALWDPQYAYKKETQEPFHFYKTPENSYTFPIRASWELGPLIIKF